MQDFSAQLKKIGEYGVVEEIHPPMVIVAGLPGAQLHEIVMFETGQLGEVFVLEREAVQILVFSNQNLKVGTRVTRTNKFLSVPVGSSMLGKVVDPLGNSYSESQKYERPTEERQIDIPPLGMPHRTAIKTPFSTGVTVIDMMLPLGKGQKELVIGDRKTGKTSFLFSTIKTQIEQGAVVVYGAVAKKKSEIKKAIQFFEQEKLMKNIVIVASSSYDSASLIYQTPYSAVTVAEYFRDQGQHVLVVLDDLSAHAKFYRELSLLAKRFPGRESYPGDIFYTHARLLERAGNYMIGGKEVSVTILPVAELVEGDFTGYIATNLMGMTDGHLYFDSNIFYRGRRPALNIALSVTRVGRQTQTSLQRSINRELTAFLALYEKMQNLSHFGAELTETVKQILATGVWIYDFFEQSITQVVPVPVQLTLFSMLWLRVFEKTSKQDIIFYRGNLIDAYHGAHKDKIEALLKAETFNQLLNNVNQNKQELLQLAGVKKVAPVQAPQIKSPQAQVPSTNQQNAQPTQPQEKPQDASQPQEGTPPPVQNGQPVQAQTKEGTANNQVNSASVVKPPVPQPPVAPVSGGK